MYISYVCISGGTSSGLAEAERRTLRTSRIPIITISCGTIYLYLSISLSLYIYIYIYVSLSTYIHIYIYIYTYRIIMYGNCNNLVPPPSNPTPSHQRLLSPTLTDMNTFGVCSPLPHLQHVTLWIASPYYSYTYRTNFSQVSYG